jgi:small subunit ribosomal protein S21
VPGKALRNSRPTQPLLTTRLGVRSLPCFFRSPVFLTPEIHLTKPALPLLYRPNFNLTRTTESMPEVQVRKGEPVDRALKRLKTKLEMEGILEEVRRLRSHETAKERLKRKARATAKRGKIRFRFMMPKANEKDAPPSA